MPDLVQNVNGKLKFPPLDPVARIHTHCRHRLCPKCQRRWRECQCEWTPKLRESIPNPPHQARSWGYKGTMILPDTHPDSPNFKGTK